MRRLIVPVAIGIVGCSILIGLGSWQVQRLAWKQGVLARIDATVTADPVPVPVAPDPLSDGYLPVTVSGALGGEEALVLISDAELGGAGYRVLSVLTTGARRVLVDLGYVPQEARGDSRMAPAVSITGNLHWPDEVDGWTPAPDAATGVWFARDLPAIAAALRAEPVLIVARDMSGAAFAVTPLPIDSAAVPNNHLTYAITWFLLAAVWAVMSGYLVLRTARKA